MVTPTNNVAKVPISGCKSPRARMHGACDFAISATSYRCKTRSSNINSFLVPKLRVPVIEIPLQIYLKRKSHNCILACPHNNSHPQRDIKTNPLVCEQMSPIPFASKETSASRLQTQLLFPSTFLYKKKTILYGDRGSTICASTVPHRAQAFCSFICLGHVNHGLSVSQGSCL